MDTLLKFLPFIPQKGDGGKLALALVFYLLVPETIGIIGGFVLGLTIILFPLGILLGLACSAYTILGIVFSILGYTGNEVGKK